MPETLEQKRRFKRKKILIKIKDVKSMSDTETIGAILVLVVGFFVYLGIQLLSSTWIISGTPLPLSFVGIGLIVGGIALIVWFIKTRL